MKSNGLPARGCPISVLSDPSRICWHCVLHRIELFGELRERKRANNLATAYHYAKLLKVAQATSPECFGKPSLLTYKIHIKHLLFVQLNSV